jgi:Tfp pilus assembly protein PilV
MIKRKTRLRRRRGVTFTEVLVAALILATNLAVMVHMWYFSWSMTTQSSVRGVAYHIARQAMEMVKETGFMNTQEGANTYYYDAQGAPQASSDVYTVTVTTVSNKFTGGVPASDSVRTVTINVTSTSTGQLLYTTATQLVRAGI